jgi:transcriptional regulator with XRE-family HTH domain
MTTQFSERLREARTRAGLSARKLDELAGITTGHTTLIESGRREAPSVETVRKLAGALNVSLDWLVNGEPDDHATEPAA